MEQDLTQLQQKINKQIGKDNRELIVLMKQNQALLVEDLKKLHKKNQSLLSLNTKEVGETAKQLQMLSFLKMLAAAAAGSAIMLWAFMYLQPAQNLPQGCMIIQHKGKTYMQCKTSENHSNNPKKEVIFLIK